MPIYEYRCDSCGHQDEHLQKVSEPLLEACPACAKATYRKLLSAAGFQLKGSGWYATDFKSTSKKPAGNAEAKPQADSDAKPEAKSESKPEPKAESKPDASPKPKSEAAA